MSQIQWIEKTANINISYKKSFQFLHNLLGKLNFRLSMLWALKRENQEKGCEKVFKK